MYTFTKSNAVDTKEHSKTEIPMDDPDAGGDGFSVDVVIMSKSGMLNIGYFDHQYMHWRWHTDAMEDLNEVDFKWMYHQFNINDNDIITQTTSASDR